MYQWLDKVMKRRLLAPDEIAESGIGDCLTLLTWTSIIRTSALVLLPSPSPFQMETLPASPVSFQAPDQPRPPAR